MGDYVSQKLFPHDVHLIKKEIGMISKAGGIPQTTGV